MLSAANPPGSPCSCKVLDQGSDERAHPPQRPSSPGADLEDDLDGAQRTHFSIRDYVFASRSKDVGTNWPFSPQYLQLCLKHGVRDLLPPFEPPVLVRERFNRCVGTDYLVICSALERAQTEASSVANNCTDSSEKVSDVVEHDFSLPAHESVLGSSHQPSKPLSEDKSAVVREVSSEEELLCGEDESKVTNHDHTGSISTFNAEFPGLLQERRSLSESSSEVEVAELSHLTEKTASSCEPSVKKCRLIVKFSRTAPEPNGTEEIVANISSISDSMSSKVCPVCKTFSSTSNTTLNAHIDQCLSVESTAKRVVIKLSHNPVKPRKKRTMEEICSTAPHCTLEDLDRRNGTNWALDLSSMAKNNEALCTNESKRPRISSLIVTDVEREGAVYVDSNGTKLLILSKFNDTPPAPGVECSGQKKFRKESGDKRISPLGKKKCLSPKHKKCWKSKVQRRKTKSYNHLKGKVRKESKFHVDTHHEKEKISQASNAQEQMKVGRPGTLGQWICSKRSSLLKHSDSKFRNRKPRNPLAIEHDVPMSVEGDQSASCEHYATGGHPKEFFKYSDELLSSTMTRNTDMPSNAVPTASCQEKHSTSLSDKNAKSMGDNSFTSNGIKLKPSRSGRDCASSVKSKRLEIHANVVHKSGKLTNSTKTPVDCHPQVRKTRKVSRRSLLVDGPQCPMGPVKCKEVVQGFVSKKLRKRRFAEKSQQMVASSPVGSFERFHDSSSAHDLSSASNDVVSGMRQINFSENFVMLETSDEIDHNSLSQGNRIDSNEFDVDYCASDGREYHTLDHSQLDAECRNTDAIKFDAQTEALANMEPVVKCSAEKSLGSCGSKIMTSEDHEAANLSNRLDSYASLICPGEHRDAKEGTMVASTSKLSGDRGLCCGVLASGAIGQDIWQVGQMGSDVKDNYCSESQNLEYQAHVASIQSFTACLTAPGNKVLELGEGSSMVSGGTLTAHIQNMAVDGEPSDSPVSATSTISHLSAEDINSKGADRGPSEEPVIIQENLRPFSRNLRLPADESLRGTGRKDSEKTNQKAKALASAEEPESFWDVPPCCCSRRESISCKPKTVRQCLMAGMMTPTKTKQMTSSLYMRPVLSSYGAYSHSRSEAAAIPVLDSPTDSISVRPSPRIAPRFPPSNTFGSARSLSPIQPQTTSSSVLRLMGKDLMVMNREDRPVQQQNQAAPCSSDNTSETKYTRHGFHSTCNFSNQDDVQHRPHPYLEGYILSEQHPSNIQAPVPLHAEPMGSFAGTNSLQTALSLKTDFHGHQKRLDKKSNYSGVCNVEKVFPHERHRPIPVTQASISEREVIVIDDSSEPEAEPTGSMQNTTSTLAPTFSSLDVQQVRPSYYPSQNVFQSREPGRVVKPGFPISRLANTDFTKWGGISESLDPHLPRVSAFPSVSAGQLAPMMYYSPSFH